MDLLKLFNENRFDLKKNMTKKEEGAFRLAIADISTRYREYKMSRDNLSDACSAGLYYLYIAYSMTNEDDHYRKNPLWMLRYGTAHPSIKPKEFDTAILVRSLKNPYHREEGNPYIRSHIEYVVPVFQGDSSDADITRKNDFHLFFSTVSVLNPLVVVPIQEHDVQKLLPFLEKKPFLFQDLFDPRALPSL